MTEFELIARYFQRSAHNRQIVLGNGDDCALVLPDAGQVLAVSSDMLVQDRHFFANVDPYSLGVKSLAVNLSDLAAMGAQPLAYTLALALPQISEEWLGQFSRGLFDCAAQHGVDLIGGDTTRGPLTISITVMGQVPPQQSLKRSGARVDDDIWVSGSLGGAALALQVAMNTLSTADADMTDLTRLLKRPVPRCALGLALRGVASAALDLSDGLAGDLPHVLRASGVQAQVCLDALPLHPAVLKLSQPIALQCALAGGDDYELCFTAAVTQRDAINQISQNLQLALTRIGTIQSAQTHDVGKITWLDSQKQTVQLNLQGYDHFNRSKSS